MKCHCLSECKNYYTRTYFNKFGDTVKKLFYECLNCKSKLIEYEIEYKDAVLVKLEDLKKSDFIQIDLD